MSVVLSIYGQQAFKQFLLPAVNNANTSIVLSKDVYRLPEDIVIELENVDHKWSFVSSHLYELQLKDSEYGGESLADGDLIRLIVKGVNVVSITVSITDVFFSVLKKYTMQSGSSQPVVIGRDDACEIQYENKLLGSQHCFLTRESSGCFVLTDRSRNGVFVNNRKAEGTTRLSFGDRIDVFGLCVVVLIDAIAVNTELKGVRVAGRLLQPANLAGREISGTYMTASKTLYHRSPRFLPQLDTEKVEIDAAPNPKELPQQSVLTTIGPSMTMALPMLLGCSISIAAASRGGMSSGAFMYTGIITAVTSACLGTFWGFKNLKNARKRAKEEEEKRVRLYGEYLDKKEKIILDKNKHNANVLYRRYASAKECSHYDASRTELWNRNRNQEDFLTHRIGVGQIPSPTEIVAPREKFTMIPDEMMERPRNMQMKYSRLFNVPVCVNLLKERLIGVAGGRARAGAVEVMKDLIVQIAANNSYTDVKIAIIYDRKDSDTERAWNFARWLPHVWNETKTFRYVAETKQDASDVFYELAKVFRQRAEERKLHEEVLPKPHYVLFIANPELLEGELISSYILNPFPQLGVTSVLVAESYRQLPNECEFIIENDNDFNGIYHVFDSLEERIPVAFDTLQEEQLETFARTLANIEITEMEMGGDIPGSLTFFDMYGVTKLSELNVMERWRKNRNYESMRALVGFKAGGAPCYLDIHEKYHGPHGLVAGTTGSGKSETLQTYILSLSLNFSPDDVGFFVIDYKGGGMANLFSNLPHLIGQISNLSGNQVRRAMVSIKSENVRRQRIFNEYGVNNINSYTKLYKNNEAKLPVPHMFIIIDEFAELKREQPDFMRELISVAQVGRSLGVHLILATQKPSGTVDDNIWSNSKFRLCLRVQDRQDSNDMLHRPDAAYITQAGRAYLQVGNDELFELFQSGWSGAVYSEDDENANAYIARMISTTGSAALEGNRTRFRKKEEAKQKWVELLLGECENTRCELQLTVSDVLDGAENARKFYSGVYRRMEANGIDYPESAYNTGRLTDLLRAYHTAKASEDFIRPEAAVEVINAADFLKIKLPEAKERTQLDAVVDYLHNLAVENGYKHSFQLWLPVLPERLLLSELSHSPVFDGSSWPVHEGDFSLETIIGLYDDPENQNQAPVTVNLADGNMAVCGAVSTGKSVFLQTMAYGLMTRYSPQELNVYVVDFSAKMLAPFEKGPHVGGVLTEEDGDKIDKFFVLIQEIISRRKALFKGGNYSQFIRSRGRNDEAAILVLFDNYGNFRNRTGMAYDDVVLQLAKEGNAYGIYLAFSGTSFQNAEIPAKLAETLKTTFALEMNDKYHYIEVVRSSHIDIEPEQNVKGRGIVKIGDRLLEYQTALSMDAEDDFARGELLEKVIQQMGQAWSGKHAMQIPTIPEKPVLEEFMQLDEVRSAMEKGDMLPIGYDAKYATIFSINLTRVSTYLITGKTRTGRSNLMKLLMYVASEKRGRHVVFDFDGELESLTQKLNMEQVSSASGVGNFFAGIFEDIKERSVRRKELIKEGVSEDEIYAEMSSFEPLYLFIGKLSSFITQVEKTKDETDVQDVSGFVGNILDKGDLIHVYWFADFNTDESVSMNGKTLYNMIIKRKTGLHLGGNVASQNIFSFNYMPFSEQSKSLKAGIGLVPEGDDEMRTRRVVIPLVKG